MKISAIIILILLFSPLMGQQNLLYPDMFAGFFNHQTFLNPAFQHDTGRVVFSATVKSRTGAFKNIATYYASLDLIFANERKSSQTIRFIFYNEKEGPYIQKPRGYANYAYRLAISRQTSFSVGASVGLMQVAFSAPSAAATGTITLPDAALGIYLKRKGIRIGVASMQVLNNHSSPANILVKLNRYYNFFMGAEKELGYLWKWNTYLLYRVLPYYQDNLDLATLFTYRNVLIFGSSARYKQGLSFFTGFNVNTRTSIVNFNFSYNTPFFADISSLNNSFEIAPSYILK